ncbi:Bromodomain-containing protein [Spinellus fusiger]|nr:Bromodomain-containing protein [Spinellus fusiger]
MSGIAQKRPFASLVTHQQDSSSDALSPRQTGLIVESATARKTLKTTLSTTEKNFCVSALKTLMKHRTAYPFLQPVDPVAFNIPDYFDIVKNPMDLSTIQKRLKNGEYASMDEFAGDIQLMLNNCYLYNNAGDPVCCDAQKLEEVFRRCMRKAPVSTSNAQSNAQLNVQLNAPLEVPLEVQSNAPLEVPLEVPLEIPLEVLSEAPSDVQPEDPLETQKAHPPKESTESTHGQSISRHVSRSPSHSVTTEPPFSHDFESESELKVESGDVYGCEGQTVALEASLPVVMTSTQFKRCENVLKEMKKPKYHDISWPFVVPVDATAWEATDYHEIIKEPMDLSTIEKKLCDHDYPSEEEFKNDFMLMFNNCFIYNPPKHMVHEIGKNYQKVFLNYWAKTAGRTSAPKAKRLQEVEKHKKELEKESTVPSSVEEQPDIPPRTEPTERPTILRLKLPIIPKQDTSSLLKEETPRETAPKKSPGLGLSKQAPQDTTRPKLALGEKPVSPRSTKTTDKKPAILQNQDSWLALAHNSKAQSSTPSALERNGHEKPPLVSDKVEERVESVKEESAAKKEPVKAFDINDLYEKIHEENRMREQQKREEKELMEKNEKARQERKRKAQEEQTEKDKEYLHRIAAKKLADQEERTANLNRAPVDISAQKMAFQSYEATHLSRDHDWREIYVWQRETVDYRHLPVPGFIRRSGVSLTELRRRLLSTRGRMQSSRSQQDKCEEDQGDSDMDVE